MMTVTSNSFSSVFWRAVKDKQNGDSISDKFVRLTVEPLDYSTLGETAQAMYTDKDGRAIITLEIGPNSNGGAYDTQLETRKYSII